VYDPTGSFGAAREQQRDCRLLGRSLVLRGLIALRGLRGLDTRLVLGRLSGISRRLRRLDRLTGLDTGLRSAGLRVRRLRRLRARFHL
jgi:hypothetical protein